MDDRFRFRVWFTPDYQEPEMIYDAEQTYDNRCQGQGSFYHESFGEILEDKDCIVMQCTGLKDKNGKLIYESDVVKIGNGSVNGSVIETKRLVKWDINKWNIPAWIIDKPDFSHYVELLGSIYENPELMEE